PLVLETRGREACCNFCHPPLEVARRGLGFARADGHDAPESSVDDDGHADRGPRAYGPRSVCDRTMRGPGVVDARRDPCLADPRDRAAVTLDGPAPPDGAEVAVGS